MKRKILLFIVLILVLIGVAYVIGIVPDGESYHLNTYTNTISGASSDTIVVNDKLDTQGGLVLEVRVSNPPNPTTGQMWLIAGETPD